MSHTPGPWEVWAQTDGSDGIVDGQDNVIAYSRHPNVKIQGANARLIAAAPDAHTCNRVALTWLEHPAVHDAFRNDEVLYARLNEAILLHRAAIAKATP